MPIDDVLSRWLPTPGTSLPLDAAMLGLTTLGAIGTVAWPLRRTAIGPRRPLCVAYLVALVLTLALQAIVARPRPLLPTSMLPVPSLSSFPSGHAVLVGIAAGWAFALRERGWPVLAILAVLVGLSRVHVGHHHPTDVIAGLALGVPAGIAAWGLTRDRGARRLRWLLAPQLALVVVISALASLGGLDPARIPLLRLPFIDKVLHFVLFGAAAFFAHFAAGGRALRLGGLRLPVAVAAPFAFACVEEILQGASAHRTFDLLDLACDLAGMIVMWRLARRVSRMCPEAALAPAPNGSIERAVATSDRAATGGERSRETNRPASP